MRLTPGRSLARWKNLGSQGASERSGGRRVGARVRAAAGVGVVGDGAVEKASRLTSRKRRKTRTRCWRDGDGGGGRGHRESELRTSADMVTAERVGASGGGGKEKKLGLGLAPRSIK